MQHSVPVHTISFNCNDSEANRFLSDLARATGGRYHYFSEKGMDLDGQPESWEVNMHTLYSKTCVKWPLSKRPKIGFQYQLSLNAGQKYCRMFQHSAILLTFIRLTFVIKIFVLSNFERLFYKGLTVFVHFSFKLFFQSLCFTTSVHHFYEGMVSESSLNSKSIISVGSFEHPQVRFGSRCKKILKFLSSNRPPDKSVTENYFSYISTKTYVVGTQNNRLDETVLLSTQITCLY